MLDRYSDCFRCHCCGELPDGGMDEKLIEVLNKIGVIGTEVTSGYRCPEHNAAVGGVADSQHVKGTAADIDAMRWSVDDLATLAESCGADGIGKYRDDCFVHIDTRGEQARWEG